MYLARMPTAITRPVTAQAHLAAGTAARYAKTRAHPQQAVYGASIVIRLDPAATSGCVSESRDDAERPDSRLRRQHSQDIETQPVAGARDRPRRESGSPA